MYNGFSANDTEITWLNGKPNCNIECAKFGGGPCPSVCGFNGYCCRRPEPGEKNIGNCPDIAKWSVLPVQNSNWRCITQNDSNKDLISSNRGFQ